MTKLLVQCKDCHHEEWISVRDYTKWRCPVCNGYPRVKEQKREDS